MKKKIIIVVGVVLLIVIFTIANLYKSKGGEIPVIVDEVKRGDITQVVSCLLYTSPSPRDLSTSRMPSSA